MLLRRLTALAAAALLVACDGTSPAPTLDGVWAARDNVVADLDSITFALGEQDSEVRGFGILRRSADPTRNVTMASIHGSVSGRSAELYVTYRTPSFPQTLVSVVLHASVSGGELSGSFTTPDGDRPVAFRRVDPRGSGVAGTYALASTSGLPLGTTGAIRDTIVALPDGRARRHRETLFFSYGVLGIWSRRGDWLMLEHENSISSQISFLDSLRIQPNGLVRTSPLGSASIVETYGRVP